MKKAIVKALSVVLVVVITLTSAPLSGFVGLKLPEWLDFSILSSAATSGTCGDNVTWSFDESTGTLIISGTGAMNDYSYANRPWFNYLYVIKTVVINNGVTTIGGGAFYECTSLTSVTISDSVTTIGDYAFRNCYYLTSITIHDGVTTIGEEAFYKCNNITSITIPNSVTTIGDYAFYSCDSLTSVTIENGVITIGDHAFNHCTSLASITVPDSVKGIGMSAFEGTAYYKDVNNWENNILYIGNHLIKIKDTLLVSYAIKEGTKTISDAAVVDCTKLTSITIPDSVTTIGDIAFSGCKSITSITIPDSVTSIGDSAFSNCRSLTNVTIGDSVTTIGEYIFYKCTSLTSITVDNNNQYYLSDEYGVLFDKNKTTLIQYPACNKKISYIIPVSVITISSCAFSNSTSLTSILIPDGVTTIGDEAFSGCKSITSITIPDSVTSIGNSAFYNCSSLTNVTIPDSVTTIANSAFNDCTGLISITIPDSVTLIDNYAFYNCTGLKELTMPVSAKIYNSKYTFYNCTNIEKVTLTKGTGFMQTFSESDYYDAPTHHGYTPWGISRENCEKIVIEDGVVNISDLVFYACYSLTSVTIPDSVTTIGNNAFSHCDSLTSVTIPDGVTTIGDDAFDGCESITNVTIPDSVTTIGDYAFSECDSLTSVTIGDSVKTISKWAFYSCDSLVHVTIGTGVLTIDRGAFSGYNSITDVYYSGTEEQWNNILIYSGNEDLTNATIHFNSTGTYPDDTYCDEFGHLYDTVVTDSNYTKEGYTTYTCTLCGDSYIADYTSKTGLSFTEDIYSFNNNASNFNTGSYTISDTYFERLCRCIESNSSSLKESKSRIGALIKYRESNWEGSCYGMSVSVLLDKLGKIAFNENVDSNAKTMYEVDNPSSNIDVMSAINYYQISQILPFNRENEVRFNKISSDWSKGLKEIVEIAKSGKIFMFQYAWRVLIKEKYHGIIVTGFNETDDEYILYAYDPRLSAQVATINIDKNYKSCVVTYMNSLGEKTEEKAVRVGYLIDFSGFDKIDIDGPDNQISYFNSVGKSNTFNTTIYFPASGDITIKNENGDTLIYSDGVLSGTMDILSENMIANSTASGEIGVATMMVEISEGKIFEVVSTSDDIDVRFLTKKSFASATVTNADSVVFDENKGVNVFGENMDYDIFLTSNMSNTDMISISGEAESNVSLVYENDAMVASGVDGENGQITVYSNLVNVEDKNFMPGYDSVMITPSSAEYGDVDILGSSNNDGNYDVSVMAGEEIIDKPEIPGEPEYNYIFSVQSPSRTEIRNKDGIVLHAVVEGKAPDGSYVRWESSNGNFDEDADGSKLEIIAKNKGWTTFTAILCDADGNELARDSVEMYSKSGFFDKIGGFFRSLFGGTKIYEN